MKTNIPDKSYKFILTALILIVTGLLCTIPALAAAGTNQPNDWLNNNLLYIIIVVFIALVTFFPVFAGFLSATTGLIILGLILLLLGSCFTGGIGGGGATNIFNILLNHFYIYIGIILIVLDLAMLGSIIVSVIGVGFIAWDIGNSIWHGGMSTWGETDLIVFGVLMGITIIAASIFLLKRDTKNKKPIITHLPIGKTGTVTEVKPDKTYKIQVNHELWNAVSSDELAVGDDVEVINIHDLTLTVRKM